MNEAQACINLPVSLLVRGTAGETVSTEGQEGEKSPGGACSTCMSTERQDIQYFTELLSTQLNKQEQNEGNLLRNHYAPVLFVLNVE